MKTLLPSVRQTITTVLLCALALFLAFSGVRPNLAAPADRTVAVLRDERFRSPKEPALTKLVDALEEAGVPVTCLTAEQAVDLSVLTPGRFFLYVIPGGGRYPASRDGALRKYVEQGGSILALGGLSGTEFVGKYDGKWADPRELIADVEPQRLAMTFDDPADLKGWRRATSDRSAAGGIELVDGGPRGGGKCLKVWTENLTGWNTFYSPRMPDLFPAGHQLLIFHARGDARTPRMLVEVQEKDGSRWMATVDLRQDWSRHVLAPWDFEYWRDASGADGERLEPANVVTINFGLAFSHLPDIGRGPHTFWVDGVGTAPSPIGRPERPESNLPHLETLYPNYKTYPLSDAVRVETDAGQAVLEPGLALPARGSLTCPVPRPLGRGLGNSRKWRWIPLAGAFDPQGRRRGTTLWMLLNLDGARAGSIHAGCALEDPAALADTRTVRALVGVVRRIRDGLFLAEGGSRRFSRRPEEPVQLGATLINTGERPRTATVKVSVSPGEGRSPVHTWETGVRVAQGASQTVSHRWRPEETENHLYTVSVRLVRDSRVTDVISHELGVLRTGPARPQDYVTVQGNDFYLRGEKWYPVGVNYWPLYVSGMEPGDFTAGWLEPRHYDPGLVERDLELMEELGMNMVSIHLDEPRCVPNLLDFLRRCRRHHIKVIGFLSGASPHGFREGRVRELIRAGRLPENPALMAYDIIWEPGNWMFKEGRRGRWDGEWKAWIVERYGSIENAEKDWEFGVPRDDGRVTSPSSAQMRRDGPWRRMVAAYRRFMDDLMSRLWNRATRRLREIDPNHLVCFRQGNILPQDFTLTATAKHVDFFCPEGYAIPHSRDGYNAAGFFNRYTHFVTRGKPIVWIEFGRSIIGRTPDYAPGSEEARKEQADYHEMFYRMALEAGANGTAPWWWPGGYRTNEQSDYGIVNPDGTPRPAAELIERCSPKLRSPRGYPEPTRWLTIDRDAHPGGYWHITFNEGARAYAEAVENGENLGIRTRGTGTTSADTPLVAVGNTPCTGHNPPKYLDAEFNFLRVENADGNFVEARDGATIAVRAGEPVTAWASVGNIQEAAWLTAESAGGETGAVYLASTEESHLQVRRPIPEDVPYLQDADFGRFRLCGGISERSSVELRMTARGRTPFGEKRTFTLVPAE